MCNAHILTLPPTYVVTGLRYDGRRFRIVTTSKLHAFGINLWRGSIWMIDTETHRRHRVKRVVN